jgi:hypothetical protein
MTRDQLLTEMTVERNAARSDERGPHEQNLADLRSIIAALARAMDEEDAARDRNTYRPGR